MSDLPRDKAKRFRLLVVKELYETEKEYTTNLQFTVHHLLLKIRERGKFDNSFTDDIIQVLFGNIEEILALHEEIVKDLDQCMPNGPTYEAAIAECYLRHMDGFSVYRKYGENNERSQKLLYELEEQSGFNAFFVAAMLLGGRSNDSINTFLFKPIQRICKYPLLFRELEKYTPEGHRDHKSTMDALGMTRAFCSVINEAKRGIERLEAIVDWQATVEGWEGSNVVDTCNELVKEGALIKISAGNTQERMFFLFDNLLVYCKKALLSRQKSLLFRGRIAVENLDIENVEDGTADYLTNGIRVANSWKVHNVAKNKWFVLIAKTLEEKQQWMEAMRNEKEKRKRFAATRARDTRNLILDKAQKLYNRAKKPQKLIRDHRARLRTYTKCFTGEDFIQWLIEEKEVGNSDEGVILGQALLENGVIHHVNDRHQFKNGVLLYRFRYDDGTFRGKHESADLLAIGVRIYCRLHGLFAPLIREQRVGLRAMKCVVNAQKLLEWLVVEGDITSREKGVALGQELFATGIIRHAADEQNFKDGAHYYRFTADDGHEGPREKERKVSTVQRVEFHVDQVLSCRTLIVPFLEKGGGYGVELTDGSPIKIKFSSPEAQLCGVCAGQTVVAINNHYVTQTSLAEDFHSLLRPRDQAPLPLHLTVTKNSSEYCSLVPTTAGLGFHIKGSSPVVIHGIDKGSAAAEVGILPGSCILKVRETDVLKASHEVVVNAIKGALSSTAGQEGGPCVSLKLSFSSLEQVTSFRYESSEDSSVVVHERTVESPYCFNVPAKLLRLYSKDAECLSKRLSQSGVKESKLTNYCTELSTMAAYYKKVASLLLAPRWPSYKPHGTMPSPALEACPTNLHTLTMDVITANALSQPPSPCAANGCDTAPVSVSKASTSYYISTMAIPSITNKNLSKQDESSLGHSLSRRDILHDLHTKVAELEKDQEILDRLLYELSSQPPHSPLNRVDSPEVFTSSLLPPAVADLRMDITPTSSPILPRRRIMSVGSPQPVVKLVADSVISKISSLDSLLRDRLLGSVLEEVDHIMTRTSRVLLSKFRDQLLTHSKEVSTCASSNSPGQALSKTTASLIKTAHKYIQEISLQLEVSLALCENVDLLQTRDKLFAQCLSALATSFAHHLMAAVEGRMNHAVEYEPSNEEVSHRWLQLICSRGVLLHLQSTMTVQESSEMSALMDLRIVAKQLKGVVLCVQELADNKTHNNSALPQVSLEGNRTSLRLIFSLPASIYNCLPENLQSLDGVKVLPVLFNKGLMDVDEGTEAYCREKDLNEKSLQILKDYYRSLRAFRLDPSLLPEDADGRKLALNQISQPLNAMDVLVRQMEVVIREPTRPGVGLLTIAAELMTRMGALRVNICDSGVFRAGMASSLEQAILLTRCHALPPRNLRTALNTLRRKGSFAYIARKNNSDIAKSFPKQPPKLYQLPPET